MSLGQKELVKCALDPSNRFTFCEVEGYLQTHRPKQTRDAAQKAPPQSPAVGLPLALPRKVVTSSSRWW